MTQPVNPHGHIILHKPSTEWLTGRALNQYSQFGEDGLIEACLEKFGEQNKHCFEVGAADGVFYSDTKRLRDREWSAVLIERDAEPFRKLVSFQNERVHCYRADIGHYVLDELLFDAGWPTQPDLGVIDIDCDDYLVWQKMTFIRPRLMLVEYRPNAEDAENVPTKSQAGLIPIIRLGTEKGYVALAQTFCNVLFCQKELLA